MDACALDRTARRVLPLLLAAVLLTACGEITDASDQPSAAPTAPACPATLDARDLRPVVPARPTAAGAEDRMVPEGLPDSVTICRYSGVAAGPSSLEGSRDLAVFDTVADDLHLPAAIDGEGRACTLIGGVHVPYLVRLQYPSGTVWVSTYSEPNGCQDTGNGAFTSKVYVGGDVAASYDAGRWTRAPSRSDNPCFDRVGRAGQERALLPDGATSIRVCTNDGQRATVSDQSTIAEITELLNRQQTRPSSGGCEGSTRRSRELLAQYPAGRSVALHVLEGCEPNAFTSSLAAQLSPADMDALLALVGG